MNFGLPCSVWVVHPLPPPKTNVKRHSLKEEDSDGENTEVGETTATDEKFFPEMAKNYKWAQDTAEEGTVHFRL